MFKPQLGSMMLARRRWQLQFEVVQHRLSTEYKGRDRAEGQPVRWRPLGDVRRPS